MLARARRLVGSPVLGAPATAQLADVVNTVLDATARQARALCRHAKIVLTEPTVRLNNVYNAGCRGLPRPAVTAKFWSRTAASGRRLRASASVKRSSANADYTYVGNTSTY